jgi:heme/copper-type cytochrome/quinol oxidase subunit 2
MRYLKQSALALVSWALLFIGESLFELFQTQPGNNFRTLMGLKIQTSVSDAATKTSMTLTITALLTLVVFILVWMLVYYFVFAHGFKTENEEN